MNILIAVVAICAFSISAFTTRTDEKQHIRSWWWISFVAAIAIVLYQGFDAHRNDRLVDSISRKLADVDSYTTVAVLNFRGSRAISRDYSLPDSLTAWNDGYVRLGSPTLSIRYDDEAIDAYAKIISKEPRYPFGHYFMAEALLLKGDARWADHAAKATAIFEKTTAIPIHSPDHDDALRNLRAMDRRKERPNKAPEPTP